MTETKLDFKFDEDMDKPDLLVLNFKGKLLLINWF